MKKKILKYVIVYTILIIAFIGTLILTSKFSSKKIHQNVKESSNVFLKEGNRKIIYIPYRGYNMQFDNYSDALMLNTAYSIDCSTPLYSSFVARKNYIPGVTTQIYKDSAGELKSSSKYDYYNPVGELNDLANGEKAESFEYARYWHGYLILLRPLLVFFNINQLRTILTILVWGLAFVLAILIKKKINNIAAIIFILGLISIEYFYLGFSLMGISIFVIAIVTSIIILLRDEKIKDLGLLFLVTGMLTNFFDFLTVPIVTLMIPLIIYFLLKQQKTNLDFKTIIKDIVTFSSIWGIAYGLTWVTKWILVDILFNKNLISTAIEQVLYRSIDKARYNIFSIISRNLICFIEPATISLIIIIFITVIKILLNKYTRTNVNFKKVIIEILPYVIISITPLCWYLVVQNHSYNHAFFTYRNLIITNLCFNIILEKILLAFFEKDKKI